MRRVDFDNKITVIMGIVVLWIVMRMKCSSLWCKFTATLWKEEKINIPVIYINKLKKNIYIVFKFCLDDFSIHFLLLFFLVRMAWTQYQLPLQFCLFVCWASLPYGRPDLAVSGDFFSRLVSFQSSQKRSFVNQAV